MKLSFCFIFFGILFVRCSDSNENPDNIKEVKSVTGNQISEPIDSLIDLIIKDGDINSYQRAGIYFLDLNPEAFLPLAVKMSSFHQYSNAYLDVYYVFIDKNGLNDANSLNGMNEIEKTIAIYYLTVSADLGNSQAKVLIHDQSKNGLKTDLGAKKYLSDSIFYKNYLDSLCEVINTKYKIYED